MPKHVFCDVTVTCDSQILITSSLSPSSLKPFLRYHINENGMDGRMDGQSKNIMPLATTVAGAEA